MTGLRRLYLTSALVCLSAVAAAGCGEVLTAADSGPGDNIDAGGGAIDAAGNTIDATPADPCVGNVAAEDMGDCYIAAICDMYTRCYGFFGTVDECIAAGGPFEGGGDPLVGLKRILDAADAGKVVYHADRAGECIAGVHAVSCVDVYTNADNIFAVCQTTFEGTVTAGNACFEQDECVAIGSACDTTAPCDLQCCAGTCVDPAGVGEDCGMVDCAEGLECVRNPSTNASRCETGEANAPCAGHFDCDSGFWCDNPAGTSLGVCKADFSADANCTEDEQCPGAQRCVGDDLNPPTALGSCRDAVASGDPCDGRCYGPLYCEQPDAATAGTCKTLPGLGEDCSVSNERCSGRLWCDTADNKCKAQKSSGVTCASSNECEAPLFCTTDIPGTSPPGSCRAPQTDGSLCDRQGQCQSSICKDNGSGVRTCQAYTNCH